MRLKGIYQQRSNYFKFSLLCLIIFISFVIHNLIISGLFTLFYKDAMFLLQNPDLSNPITVNYLKLVQGITSVGIFIFPLFIYAYLTRFNFNLVLPNRQNTLLAITIMILITPFISLLIKWNMYINFPDWIMRFDINSDDMIIAFLKIKNIYELLFTILILAVIPAIGEELLFRGYIQNQLGNIFKKMWFSILLTSVFFSIIHMDVHGLIPRFFLGVILGYLFYWSQSIWIPIIAHFINNAQAVIIAYITFKSTASEADFFSETDVDYRLAVFSLLSVLLLLYLVSKTNRKIEAN